MVRKLLVVMALASVTSVALLDGQAAALPIWWNPYLPAVVTSLNLAGTCVPDYVGVGVGSSGGLNYTMQGYGSNSTNAPATQVGCRFWDTATDAPLGTWESGYKAGPAAALVASFTVDTLDPLITCIKVDSLDPETGAIESTGWTSSDGSYCG